MAKLGFAAQVDAWVKATDQRLEAVFKTATQVVFEDVILRTPVDTGYLRAGFTASLQGMLPLTGSQGDGYKAPPYQLVISGAKVGGTIYGSFVANYAAHVEYGANGREGAGMVRLAAQAWPQHVNRAVLAAKARVAARTPG